jgi:hypothetical protein
MHIPQRTADRSCFSVIGIVLSMFIASAAMGSERELDQGPPPGSAFEIETPIQKVFPGLPEVRSVFPDIRESIKDQPPFLSGTQLEVRLRTAYFDQDGTFGLASEAWAAGGSVYYRSGWLGDVFSVEAEGFTSQSVYAPDDKGGTGLLAPAQEGYSALGIANAKLRRNGIVLTVGRQYLDLPYVNRADNRMTPNTFESVTLANTAGELRFTTGYTWKIKRRTSEDFVSMTNAIGLDEDRGLAHLGLIWDPNEDFHMGVTGGVIRDLFAGIYAELGVGRDLANGWEARLDTQFTQQWDIGDDLYGTLLEDAWNFGVRTSASRAGVVLRLGMSQTGPDAGVVSLYGTRPSYVDLMQRSFNLADETAFLASASYDFSGRGLAGLSIITNFVAGFGGEIDGLSGDRKELDLTIDYRIKDGLLKNFWLRFRTSWLDSDLGTSDGTDNRVILRYDIPII